MNCPAASAPEYQFAFVSEETGKRMRPGIRITDAAGNEVSQITYGGLNMSKIAFLEDAFESILGKHNVAALYEKARPALAITEDHVLRIAGAISAALG